MTSFLCFPTKRRLMLVLIGLFFLMKGPEIRLVPSNEPSDKYTSPMLAQALSTTPSSPRRPPRIRPKRQSPSSDEASYGETPSNSQSNSKNRNKASSTNKPINDKSSKTKHQEALQDPSLLTGIRFQDRDDLHPHTKEALAKGLGLETMTVVQAATYEAALEGRSVLAKSKTGSGKTLAFLLPALERLLSDETFLVGRSIGCVILAPTRELAIQIADQAEILIDYHNKYRPTKSLRVACIYGGVKMQRDVRQLTGDRGGMADLPTLLVATPSRLLEHLEGNSPLQKNFRKGGGDPLQSVSRGRKSKSQFAQILAQTKIVVLDETDRLLQKANLKETQNVLGYLARKEKRQTLLFSATFPRAVRRLLSNTSILSNSKDVEDVDFLEVDCYRNDERNESTEMSQTESSKESSLQKRVQESFVSLTNMSQFIPTLLTAIRREQQRDSQNYKILVFFPAGRLVRFLFQFFTIGGLEKKEHLWEIHSRMSQSSRTRASSSFRNARRGILFSSDVSARGLDYPDVSLVVQMGAPSSDQDYVHRIGRTGRAGKAGKGLLVYLPFETRQTTKRKGSYRSDASIEEDLELASWIRQAENTESLYQKCKSDLEPTQSKVRSGHVVLTPGAKASYKTFLAHYIPTPNRKSKESNKQTRPSEILQHAQDFVEGIGLANIPDLDNDFASKLGLPNRDY